MRNTTRALTAALLAALAAAPALAQNTPGGGTPPDSTTAESIKEFSQAQQIPIQHFRPTDKRGVNMFEAPKHDAVPYTGFKLMLGGGFTQDFQNIRHSNTADPKVVSGVDQNELADIGPGFNNAVANLYLTAQLARGISVHMTSYLSSRHHSETWVKDG